eukprot:3985402-Pyramimonas_sp.AAC.2
MSRYTVRSAKAPSLSVYIRRLRGSSLPPPSSSIPSISVLAKPPPSPSSARGVAFPPSEVSRCKGFRVLGL